MARNPFGSKRLQTLLAGLFILLAVTGIAAAQTGVVIDDFEDGDLSEWTTDSQFSISQTQTYEGQYSMVFDSTEDAINYQASRPLSVNSPSELSTWVYMDELHDGNDRNDIVLLNSGSDVATARITDNDVQIVAGDGSSYTVYQNLNQGQWYRISMELDYSTNQFSVVLYDESGTELGASNERGFENAATDIDEYNLRYGSDRRIYMDFITSEYREAYPVSGTVTDDSNEQLSGVTIEATNESGSVVATDTTDSVGSYSLYLENGTYDITASKNGYLSSTQTVTVSGSDVENTDFQLTELNSSINLVTRNYLQHGQRGGYTVVIENNTGRYNVTQQANVTTANATIVTVDDTALEIIGTNDTSVGGRTYIEATYTDSDGNDYTTTANVTVANKTVENLDILPTGARLGASVEDSTIQVILVATMFGAGVAFASRAFAGLATITLIMTLGWLGGRVSNGMVIVSFMIALFIGLNVATNIDYNVGSVR